MSEWKETEIGRIPSSWEICTLEEISEIITDGAHVSPKPVKSEFLMASVKDMRYNYFDFSDCKTISREDFESLENGKCSPEFGDILLSKDGANCLDLIFVYKQNKRIVLLSSIAIARLKKEHNYDFYRYYLLSPNIQEIMRNNYVSGSAIPRVILKDFKNVPVPVLPIEEQTSIASLLSSLDDKIDLLHLQNTTLEKMAETLFRQWFVEEAKEEWEFVKMESLISIGSGKGLKKESFIENGLYPILGANGEIGKTNEFLFDEKLIYTGRVGTLGNIFRIENEKVWLSDNTLVIKPLEYFNFIYLTLKTSRLEDYNVGSTQPLIRQSDVKEIEVVLPSKEKLLEFESISDNVFQKIKSNQIQIRTLTAMRDNLLPKLMSGEVRVNL